MKYYEIPSKIINLVKMSYENFRCAVEHEGKLSKWFPMMSGVRQGCVMSGFLFVLVIDCIMRKTTRMKRGIQCGLDTKGDIDFADDLALLSTSRRNLQQEINELEVHAKRTGLQNVENVDSFTYLGSVMDADKGSTADISARLKNARAAYYKLRKVWASSQYRRKTKLRIYKSNVMSVLLYGAECWKVNQNDGQRLNAFHNICLRRILHIFWPRTITNEKLYEEVEISRITDIIKARRWSFIGHILLFENTNDCRIVMNLTPVGKRSIGRPKETWRRMVEKRARWVWVEIMGRGGTEGG